MMKRLRLAWRFRVWPWRIPKHAVEYLSMEPLTMDDVLATYRVLQKLSRASAQEGEK